METQAVCQPHSGDVAVPPEPGGQAFPGNRRTGSIRAGGPGGSLPASAELGNILAFENVFHARIGKTRRTGGSLSQHRVSPSLASGCVRPAGAGAQACGVAGPAPGYATSAVRTGGPEGLGSADPTARSVHTARGLQAARGGQVSSEDQLPAEPHRPRAGGRRSLKTAAPPPGPGRAQHTRPRTAA